MLQHNNRAIELVMLKHTLRVATRSPGESTMRQAFRCLLFALLAQLPTFASAAENPVITIVDSDQTVEARIGEQPLLRYNKAHVEPPAGVNPKFGRSAH